MFNPLKGKVFVTDMEQGMRMTSGGIILTDDNRKEEGIRPRWSKVAKISDDIDFVKVGEWVLLPHGRWTLGMDLDVGNGTERVWMIDNDEILLIADENPLDEVRYEL